MKYVERLIGPVRREYRNLDQAILASHFDPDLACPGKFNRLVYEIDQDL